MKTRVFPTILFLALSLIACTNSPQSLTTSTVRAIPTEIIQVPTQTSISPTATPISTVAPPVEEPITPGIYPVYFKEGTIYIVLPTGNAQELLQLFDPQTDNPNHWQHIRDTIASPDGKFITYYDSEDGYIYNYDWQLKTTKKIPQPEPELSRRGFSGNWSPDGKYLLYAIDQYPEGISFSIFITDIAKNSYARLTNWKWYESNPSWSPDSQWITFASDRIIVTSLDGRFTGFTDIFIMSSECVSNIETCNNYYAKPLTNTGSNGNTYYPVWNPDGSEIACIYGSGLSWNHDVYLLDLDGNANSLTNTPSDYENNFSWSPDGEKLVIWRKYIETIENIETLKILYYILDLSDNTTTEITNSPVSFQGMAYWSPDEGKIALNHRCDPDIGITIYSVQEEQVDILPNTINSSFLFWLTVFPDITNGATLLVSPSGKDIPIYNKASLDSLTVGTLQPGNKITILDQPLDKGRYSWWRIKSDQAEGWVLQNYNWYLPE
jgi:Tol biopolymer transport system component